MRNLLLSSEFSVSGASSREPFLGKNTPLDLWTGQEASFLLFQRKAAAWVAESIFTPRISRMQAQSERRLCLRHQQFFWLAFLVIPPGVLCAGVDTHAPSDDCRTWPLNTTPLNDSWKYRRTLSGIAHCDKL